MNCNVFGKSYHILHHLMKLHIAQNTLLLDCHSWNNHNPSTKKFVAKSSVSTNEKTEWNNNLSNKFKLPNLAELNNKNMLLKLYTQVTVESFEMKKSNYKTFQKMTMREICQPKHTKKASKPTKMIEASKQKIGLTEDANRGGLGVIAPPPSKHASPSVRQKTTFLEIFVGTYSTLNTIF